MTLLKNCRSFLSNFFFIPVGMLQVSHANFIKSIELYISIEKFEFSIIRGYVFHLEQVPAYSCFIGYVSWQVIISVFWRIPRASWNAKGRLLSLSLSPSQQ
ncbi:uncharacterized protein DS421_18g618360 [Arachis hypogaea]|nr:uncharacterized protein DS421_18g618360 [Arachis hypogaea]